MNETGDRPDPGIVELPPVRDLVRMLEPLATCPTPGRLRPNFWPSSPNWARCR
jgi:hypothetical protein